MRKLQILSIALIFSVICISITAQEKTDSSTVEINSGSLIVRLIDFSSEEGKAMTALYDSEENYNKSIPFRAFASKITNGKVEYTFEEVPFGIYAIKCYHDENENGELDSNMLGVPTEDYGFSNNARGSFGPAKYKDAKFVFNADKQVIEINLD